MEEEIIDIEENTKTKESYLKQHYKQILMISGLVIIVAYLIGIFYFNGKFLNNTTINGIDISMKSPHEIHDIFNSQINNHSLTLTFIDNQTETLESRNSGITYNQDNKLNDLYNQQNHWLWFTSFFNKSELTLDDIINIDDVKLTQTIHALKHLQEDQQVAPINAFVDYKDNTFSIIKENNGSTIKLDTFKKEIINSFASLNKEMNVLKNGGYVLPEITSKDEKLNSLLEAANKYAKVSITYETTSGKITLDGNDIMKWLSIDENGHYYKDDKEFEKQATAFVKKLSQKVNNIGTRKTYTLANGRQVSVSGGNYGLKLKQKEEVQGLLKDIANGKSGIRKPKTSGVQASYSNNGLGNTFVEVDLSRQMVYLVKNGRVALSSSCVTGKYTDPERRTPAGTYYLYGKQRNRVLRGTRLPDGTWPYESPVSYWMPFNRGIGLHDASWRNKFGGDIYYNKGSHGCINLPVSFAGQLYSSISVNTPVVCHY